MKLLRQGGIAAQTALLLRPKILSAISRGRQGRAATSRALTLSVGGLAGLAFLFFVAMRLLRALRGVEEVGPLLASKMLGLGLLLFLAILLLSNLIAALSSFFLARDLPMVLSSPVDGLAHYLARLTETVVGSSWMVLLMLAPILAAYQVVYGAGVTFYALAIVALIPFLLIPAAFGSAVTLVLVNVFPARRTRDLMGIISVAAGAALVGGLRLLRPERLVNPDGFRNLVDFLEVLRGPSSPWLPSEWTAQVLVGQLHGSIDPFWLLLSWTTAGGLVVLGAALHARLYHRGFTRAQEGQESVVRHTRVWAAVSTVLRPVGGQRRHMILKDARVFFRDATQWSQLLVLGVLLFVYVYNIRVLPVHANEAISRLLVSILVFLNVALAGFILAAIAARFVLPAFSLEGSTLWLLRSSPLRPAALVWSKYWAGAVPLLALALSLTIVTNRMLQIETGLMWLSLVTISALTLALVAQALAWGIALPKFECENAAQIPTSLGGLLFMLGALINLVAVLLIQFWSLRDYLRSGLPGHTPRAPLVSELALAIGVTLTICGLATVLPYMAANRRVRALGR